MIFITFVLIVFVMKNRLELFKKYLGRVNKYVFAIIVFVIVTFFIGDATIFNQISYNKEISLLKSEIEQYTKLKEENQQKLNDLHSNDGALEKFAREQYQMTMPEEDLYIIVD
jgi:cell division protein FtsB